MNENLKLWDSVQATDPKYTKAFSRAGGFRGTAINATYQIRRATEQWGPIGGKWGCSIVSSDFVPGADGDVVHVALIDFWHPAGRFQTFGQTTFVGSNKNGKFTDEEAPKKSLTDAITKALSMLGFSADVHLGLFDDNKYVNDMKQQFDESKPAKPVASISPNDVGKDFWNNANAEERAYLQGQIDAIRGHLAVNEAQAAATEFYAMKDQEEALAVWSQLGSKERASIKQFKPEQKAA